MVKFGCLLLAIGLVSLVHAQQAKCPFNDACTCVQGQGSNNYAEVSCVDVKGFPKFTATGNPVTVQKFLIRGDMEVMPQAGLEAFSRIEHLIINRNGAGFAIDGSDTMLANATIGSLTLMNFPNVFILQEQMIDKSTLSGISRLSVEDSSLSMRFFQSVFSDANALKSLTLIRDDLADNNFNMVPNLFKELADTLVDLDLSQNMIANGRFGLGQSVSDLVKLETLRLNDNHLQTAAGIDLSKLVKLKLLDLSNNKDLGTLGNLTSTEHILEELHMNNCGLQQIPQDALKQLTSLKRLSLAHNKIEKLSESDFLKNVHLQSLNLDGNPIQEVEPNAFNQLVSLQNFSVCGWDLRELDLSVFSIDVGGGVEILRVSDNHRLETITWSNSTWSSNLGTLEVRNNSLRALNESLEILLDGKLNSIQIAQETNFQCPPLDTHHHDHEHTTWPPMDNVTYDNETGNFTISNETISDDPGHNHEQHPLMWLAKRFACHHQVHVADDVYCEPNSDRNSTEPLRLSDYLLSLKPNCTGITGTTTTTTMTTTPGAPPSTSDTSTVIANPALLLFVAILSVLGRS